MADTEPFLDDASYAELLLQLRADRSRKLELIASLTEGVILAVEQVQDLRLATLEEGPESSASDLVADAFWGFLFDSGINVLWSRVVVGKFLLAVEKMSVGLLGYDMHAAKSARKEVKALTALRAALYDQDGNPKKKRSDVARNVADFLDQLAARKYADAPELKKGVVSIRKFIDDQLGKQREASAKAGLFGLPLLARDLRVRYGRESSEAASAAVAVENLLHLTRNYLNGGPGDSAGTPSASLLASVYDWASRQRQQVTLMCDELEIRLTQSKHTENMAGVCMVLGVSSDALPLQLGEVRTRSWLLSEAVIWGEVLSAYLVGDVPAKPEDNTLLSVGVPEKLAAYLIERFAEDALTWVASPNADTVLIKAPYEGLSVQAPTAENATPLTSGRKAAARHLGAARDRLKNREHIKTMFGSKEADQKFAATVVNSSAVVAFLLGMRECYRSSASFLLEQLTSLREELRD